MCKKQVYIETKNIFCIKYSLQACTIFQASVLGIQSLRSILPRVFFLKSSLKYIHLRKEQQLHKNKCQLTNSDSDLKGWEWKS